MAGAPPPPRSGRLRGRPSTRSRPRLSVIAAHRPRAGHVPLDAVASEHLPGPFPPPDAKNEEGVLDHQPRLSRHRNCSSCTATPGLEPTEDRAAAGLTGTDRGEPGLDQGDDVIAAFLTRQDASHSLASAPGATAGFISSRGGREISGLSLHHGLPMMASSVASTRSNQAARTASIGAVWRSRPPSVQCSVQGHPRRQPDAALGHRADPPHRPEALRQPFATIIGDPRSRPGQSLLFMLTLADAWG